MDDIPIIAAAERGDLDAVKRCLAADIAQHVARKDAVNVRDGLMESCALHVASEAGQLPIVQFLLDNQADVAIPDVNGVVALHLACGGGHLEVARALLSSKANPNAREKILQDTPFHWACSRGYMDIAAALIEKGAKVDAANKWGWTALHLAAYNGHKQVVELLLSNKASLSTANTNGDTALHLACSGNRIEVVEVLIKRGANKDIRNTKGFSPGDMSKNVGVHFLLGDAGYTPTVLGPDRRASTKLSKSRGLPSRSKPRPHPTLPPPAPPADHPTLPLPHTSTRAAVAAAAQGSPGAARVLKETLAGGRSAHTTPRSPGLGAWASGVVEGWEAEDGREDSADVKWPASGSSPPRQEEADWRVVGGAESEMISSMQESSPMSSTKKVQDWLSSGDHSITAGMASGSPLTAGMGGLLESTIPEDEGMSAAGMSGRTRRSMNAWAEAHSGEEPSAMPAPRPTAVADDIDLQEQMFAELRQERRKQNLITPNSRQRSKVQRWQNSFMNKYNLGRFGLFAP